MELGKKIGQRLGRAQYSFSRDLESLMDACLRRWDAGRWTKIEILLFWSMVFTVVFLIGYLMLSGLCWIGADCTFASSHLADWLFGNK